MSRRWPEVCTLSSPEVSSSSSRASESSILFCLCSFINTRLCPNGRSACSRWCIMSFALELRLYLAISPTDAGPTAPSWSNSLRPHTYTVYRYDALSNSLRPSRSLPRVQVTSATLSALCLTLLLPAAAAPPHLRFGFLLAAYAVGHTHSFIPILDSFVLHEMREKYGNARLWGSVGFGVASLAGGAILKSLGAEHGGTCMRARASARARTHA